MTARVIVVGAGLSGLARGAAAGRRRCRRDGARGARPGRRSDRGGPHRRRHRRRARRPVDRADPEPHVRAGRRARAGDVPDLQRGRARHPARRQDLPDRVAARRDPEDQPDRARRPLPGPDPLREAGAEDPARRAVDRTRRRPARRPDVRHLDPTQPADRRRTGVLPHRHRGRVLRRVDRPLRPARRRSTPTRGRTSRRCCRSTGARRPIASSAARGASARPWPPSSATGCGRRRRSARSSTASTACASRPAAASTSRRTG